MPAKQTGCAMLFVIVSRFCVTLDLHLDYKWITLAGPEMFQHPCSGAPDVTNVTENWSDYSRLILSGRVEGEGVK